MIIPDKTEAGKFKGKYKFVPVAKEIYSDIRTPIQVLKALKAKSNHVYMLESVENQENWGRYTFLGYNPTMCVTMLEGELVVKDDKGNEIKREKVSHPGAYLREIIEAHRSPRIEGLPTFTGGLVGYFSYDYIKYREKNLVLDAADEEHFKDMDLMLFDKVIAFDNLKQKIVVIANACLDNLDENYEKAVEDIDEIIDVIKHGEEGCFEKGRMLSEYRPLFNEEEFCSMVNKAKDHIFEGDIFQVVLSNRLEVDFEGSLFDTYRVLRTINPSPYMFYFSGDDVEVAGASPETLIKLEDGILRTYPLAGTRKRI